MATAAQASDVEAFTHDRFIDMFLSQNRRAQMGLFGAALLVALVWFEATRSSASLVWLTGAAVIAGMRFRYTAVWIQAAAAAQRTRRVVTVLWVNGVLMAVPLVAFQHMSGLAQSALSIILLANATASVATTSGYRSVFVAFAAPMLVPLALAWAWIGWAQASTAALGMAVLIGLFLLFLVSVGRQANAVFIDACKFRFGQQHLNRELTKALNEASMANRAKTQFLAAASHDLRQPIHSMNVLVAALSLRELDAPAREIVGLLGTVNQLLSQQLDTLLDMSKLDAGVVRADSAVHCLGQLVQVYHGATLLTAQERGLKLEVELYDDIFVATDSSLLTRALSNLTDNALKYTPRGGTIRLLVRREGDDAVLQVADNGIGIAADEQERVFGEFYQVGNVERDRQKGLGLGLSIVRRLCALLGVRLKLESRPGVGTTVTLRLATVDPSGQVALAHAPRRAAPGLRVLVVDDEALVRDSMRLLLAELGCSVHLADGPAAAGQVASEHRLDLVLSDLRLRNGQTGLDALRLVRASQPAVAAILITGDTAPERIRDAQDEGVPLLFKPVTLDKLLSVLPTVPP